MSEKSIEITVRPESKPVVVSQSGVQIWHQGKPVSSKVTVTGYVYMVVDCSWSMDGDKLNQAKKGALRFAKDALAKSYSTGLIEFHSYASHLCKPHREVSKLKQCLMHMEAGGSTNMTAAIRLAHQELMGKKGMRAMVIVTDGEPDNVKASLKAGKAAKKDNIDIITIGTDHSDHDFLKKLASRTELGIKVSREQFEQGIASSVKMLPA